MFHIIQSLPIKLLKPQLTKVIFLLPLSQNRIVAITDNDYLLCFSLVTKKLIRDIILPLSPRKVVVLSNDNIVLVFPASQTLAQLHLNQKLPQIQTIHQFERTTHYLLPKNPNSQKQYYSTMKVQSFLLAQSLFIEQQNPEGRKSLLKLFHKKEKKWEVKCKQLGNSQIRILKMNQYEKLALIRSNALSQGSFRFHTVSITNLDEEEVKLQSQSFDQFSTVFAIKQSNDTLYVQINQKNPELLCFVNHHQKSSCKVGTNIVWVINLKDFIFELGLSLKKPQLSRLRIRRQTEYMDEVQSKFQNLQICKSGLILEYQRQRVQGQLLSFQTHRPINKTTLYLDLIKKRFPKTSTNRNFMNEVISLLEQ